MFQVWDYAHILDKYGFLTASGYDGGSVGLNDAEAIVPASKDARVASIVAYKAKVGNIVVVFGSTRRRCGCFAVVGNRMVQITVEAVRLCRQASQEESFIDGLSRVRPCDLQPTRTTSHTSGASR